MRVVFMIAAMLVLVKPAYSQVDAWELSAFNLMASEYCELDSDRSKTHTVIVPWELSKLDAEGRAAFNKKANDLFDEMLWLYERMDDSGKATECGNALELLSMWVPNSGGWF